MSEHTVTLECHCGKRWHIAVEDGKLQYADVTDRFANLDALIEAAEAVLAAYNNHEELGCFAVNLRAAVEKARSDNG